jgi:hypothetical protein
MQLRTLPQKTLSIKTEVFSDDGGRVIGIIRDRTFIKTKWHSSKHLCFKHHAIGIDKGAFEAYVLPSTEQIKCHDRDKGVTYTVSTADFKLHTIEDDLGWGTQLFCPLEYWQVQSNARGRQLGFWEGEQ